VNGNAQKRQKNVPEATRNSYFLTPQTLINPIMKKAKGKGVKSKVIKQTTKKRYIGKL